MTGIVGGTVDGRDLSSLVDSLYREDWYETRSRERGGAGIGLVDHGAKDPLGNLLWADEDALGVVHGVISNRDDLPWTTAELFRRILDRPAETLPQLEGPFALACIDSRTDRVVLATDKAGSRPCYYFGADSLVPGDGFVFGSELKPFAERTDDPRVDRRAVGDLLLMGTVIGEKTLIEGVANLPPATYAEYHDGTVETERYWYPDFEGSFEREYADEWIARYRSAMDDVSGTIHGRFGLWLSGGLDSRIAAATLSDVGRRFETYTYRDDFGRGQAIAQRVSDQLGVECSTVTGGTSAQFLDSLRKSVRATDGMMAWRFFASLPFMFHGLADAVDVVMEGGTFLGEDLPDYYLKDGMSTPDVVYKKKRQLPAETVEAILTDDVDPLSSIRAEADQCYDGASRYRSLDAMRRFYSYSHMRSNLVQRSQVGTRVVSDGPFLEHVLRMPDDYRMRTLPFTDGAIPYGVPQIKLSVSRRLNRDLARIPYNRTNLPPTAPYLLHTAGFALNEVRDRIAPRRSSQYLNWYREDPVVRRFLDDLLDAAAERPFLDADALDDLRRGFVADGSHLTPIAAVTGLEFWLQEYLD